MPTALSWQDLHTPSIRAFYDGKLDDGRLACDLLLVHPDTPEEYRDTASRNATYYAPALSTLSASGQSFSLDALPDVSQAAPHVPWETDHWHETPLRHLARRWVAATPLVPHHGHHLTITREVANFRDGRVVALHRLLRLDTHLRPMAMSHPFRLAGDDHEAAVLLDLQGDRAAVIALLHTDQPWAAKLPLADLLATLQPLEAFAISPASVPALADLTWEALLATPVFVINLDRHPGRWDITSERLRQAGFTDIRRYRAVDAQEPETLRSSWAALGNPPFDPVDPAFARSGGKQGCFLSHVHLWQEIASRHIPLALIVEDDLLFHPDWHTLGPAYLAETPRDADLIYLHGQVAPPPQDRVIRRATLCTAAYLVTARGANVARDIALSAPDGVRTIDIMLEAVQRQESNGSEDSRLRWYTWNTIEDAVPPLFPVSDAKWLRNVGLVGQDHTLGSSVTRTTTVASYRAEPAALHRDTPRRDASPRVPSSPFDILSCTAPIPVSSVDFQQISAAWDAPTLPATPHQRWNTGRAWPTSVVDLSAFFADRFPETTGAAAQAIVRIRMRSSGDFVLRSTSPLLVRGNGHALIHDTTTHDLGAHPQVFRAEHGDVIEIATANAQGPWQFAIDVMLPEPAPAPLATHLPKVLDRLANPDGPPLVVWTDGTRLNGLALTVYSTILNGYAPSSVEIHGDIPGTDQRRQRLADLLPFARFVPTAILRQRLRDIGGYALDAAADADPAILRRASALLGPEVACFTNDRVVTLSSLRDAIAAFDGSSTVTIPSSQLDAGLSFRRRPASLLAAMTSESIAFPAFAAVAAPTIDVIETDLAANHARHVAVSLGISPSRTLPEALVPALAEIILRPRAAAPTEAAPKPWFRWDPALPLGPQPIDAPESADRQFRPGGDPETYLPDIYAWLCWRFGITSVLDIGCGAGVNLEWFAQNGLRVLGVDGDPEALAASRIPDDLMRWDFTHGPLHLPQEFDLGLSTEFVEHVEQRFEQNWITAARACRHLLISHAIPGQGGYFHVNEQPSDYWITRLAENGFTYQPAITAYLRATDHWRPSLWGRPHLLFFTRDDVIATERSGGTHPA